MIADRARRVYNVAMIGDQSRKSSTRIRIATNTISQIIGRFFTSFITLIISIFIARMYGPSGYGDFTKITTFVAIFYLLCDFGFNAIYLRESSGDRDTSQSPLWQVLLTMRLLLSLLYVFLTAAILVFLPTGSSSGYTPLVKVGILIFSGSIIAQSITTTINAIFQQKLRYDLSVVAASCGSIISVILVWIITVVYLPNIALLASVGSLLIGTLVTSLIGFVFVRRFTPLRFVWDMKKMLYLFSQSLPLGITLLFNVIYFRADNFILTFTRSTTEVGIYGLAYKFFEFPLAIPTFYMNAVYPVFLQRLQASGMVLSDSALGIIKKSFIFLIISSITISIVLWTIAPYIRFIRPEFSQSIMPLQILLVGLPFYFVSSLTMWIFIALRKQTLLVVVYGISMIGNILLNLRFIPTYGYMAASWITVLSEAMICIVSGIILWKYIKQSGRTRKYSV